MPPLVTTSFNVANNSVTTNNDKNNADSNTVNVDDANDDNKLDNDSDDVLRLVLSTRLPSLLFLCF